MSVMKSQIHDGFATIRHRGLHRSRSRAEQLERRLPRCESTSEKTTTDDPLYENKYDMYYNFRNSSAVVTTDEIPHQKIGLPEPLCSSQLRCLSKSSNSFKSADSDRGRMSPFVGPQSPDSLNAEPAFLYTRPESPIYAGSLLNGRDATEQRGESVRSPPSRIFTPTYYRRGDGASTYALEELSPVKPPAVPSASTRAKTLNYRKSYSHPGRPIVEAVSMQPADLYYNTSTNYYSPEELYAKSLAFKAVTDNSHNDKQRVLASVDKRFATLSYPKESQRLKQQRFSASNSGEASSDHRHVDAEVDYLDPLDCKIGCQTTLRSKPRIPWYELAIRKDNRRQSCPPEYEAHVVAAFEQSLTNMTQRLQQLSVTADRKDGELTEMRQTIELLRKQSIQAGLTSAHMNSMNIQHPPSQSTNPLAGRPPIPVTASAEIPPALPPANPGGLGHGNDSISSASLSMQRHLSADSMCSLNSMSSDCSAQDKKKKKGWLRNSFTKAFSRNAKITKTSRQVSTASHLDQAGISSGIPPPLPPLNSTIGSSNESGVNSSLPPPSPSKSPRRSLGQNLNNGTSATIPELDFEGNPIVEDLKKQLREKDLVLTDIRLEALSSASQLECLKDTVSKMRQEMMNLKQNNERLQKMVTSRSLAGSECSLGGPISPSGSMGEPRRYSLAEANMRPPIELPKSLDETEEENVPPAPAPEPPPSTISMSSSPSRHSSLTSPTPILEEPPVDALAIPAEDLNDHTDGKKISIVVYLGQPESFTKYAEEIQESDIYYSSTSSSSGKSSDLDANGHLVVSNNRTEFVIAFTYISGKTTWQNLDYIVRKTFKDYVARIDPGTNLGLNTDSITSYHLGDAKRGPEMGFPELLPCGYIIGSVRSLYICLQGVGSLAFESLIPRSIVHRYISLLTEHRRLILCGPSGTGKSYLARKLAEFLVARSQRGTPSSEAIATFNVDHKSQKELRQYLGHIAEQASLSNGDSEDLPSVIILDNLHHASALGDVFQVLLGAGPAAKLPCIIGTMSQATCNTTNLQLHHNFRWVLTANHMEPVKGFLGRYLRRRLYAMELATHTSHPQLASILAWLPGVWQHINQFLETHSSSDVTIGPRLFLSCPLDVTDSQVWFTDVWNYHLEPYLVEAVREGVQLYGRRGGVWVDPSEFIHQTYPWPMLNGAVAIPPLRLINAEDVGLENGVAGNMDSQDPLVNMLMRLQEAANYSGVQEQESDCASLDSNITQDSSAGAD